MICVSDNIQITRKTIENAITYYDKKPLVHAVNICEHMGANVIDINPGPLTRNPRDKMRFIVETVQEATNLPLMLDTANPVAMEEGLN